MPRVFDRFYRDINSEQQGSSLGLAIARQIAELHGATITLKNGSGADGGVVAEVLFTG